MLKYPDVRDYIFVYDLLSEKECDKIVARLNKRNKWREHKWYDAAEFDYKNHSDFDTCSDHRSIGMINPKFNELLEAYSKKYTDKENTNSDINWARVSPIKFNRYSVGQSIEAHHDHIHDMFDGNIRGIPVSSIIGVLNDDYEGGELIFWNQHHVPLKKGQVAVFPSVFLFPHSVNTVVRGVRYSWACFCA